MKINLGDTIGIISPSGAISDKEGFYERINYISQIGYKVKVFPNALKQNGYLAGEDKERLLDLHSAFLDDEVKVILASRGGFGAIRILDDIDYEIIKNNPKIFIGSSDITAFLAAFYAKSALVSYHSPMLMNGFCFENFERYINLINNQKEILPKKKFKTLLQGDCEGILWGGNLSTIVSLFGSFNYLPDKNIILFLEDINEPLYKIDKMLMQIYRNFNLREKIKGIIFGEFLGLNKDEQKKLETLLLNYAKKFSVPTYYNYDITHGKNNTVVPFGKSAKLFGGKICLL